MPRNPKDDPIITPSYSYTHYAIQFLGTNMSTAKRALEGFDFDMIVGPGLSGTLVAPRLAKILKVYWGIARKPTEESHRERMVEGTRMGQRWLFVDDFIATGATFQRVTRTMEEHCRARGLETTLVGSYEYKTDRLKVIDGV